MIFSGRRKRQQSPPRPGDRHQCRIENSDAENQQRSQERRRMVPGAQSQLQSQRRHQETQEHRSAVAHENLRRLEVPAQKAGCRAKKKEAVAATPAHSPSMWSSMLNDAVIATTQKMVSAASRKYPARPGTNSSNACAWIPLNRRMHAAS